MSEGEVITKIDFALVRGGVVTGRITDADGHPLIGEHVSVLLKDAPATARQMMMFGGSRNQTDDRGVYRVYGLSPGSYKVSVGPGRGRRRRRHRHGNGRQSIREDVLSRRSGGSESDS
mgnify:CR=1 FL=1